MTLDSLLEQQQLLIASSLGEITQPKVRAFLELQKQILKEQNETE